LKASVVAFGGLGRVPEVAAPSLRGLTALSGKARALRGLGSAALHLAYVACGRLEASFDMSLSVWDTAAGSLLVEEAGGRMSSFAGGAFTLTTRDTVATNGAVHDELLALLREAGAAPPAQ
jgi:myo-inositol-1(or 4)-monophosphatase